MRDSEKNRKQILLNCEKLETRYAQLTNGRLEEYVIERVSNGPVVGSVYLGKIVNLAPALEAAFVDIGLDKNAFLHYQDMLSGADDLLEQMSDPVTARRIAGKSGVKASSLRKFITNLNGRKLRAEDIPEIFKPGMEILVEVIKTPIGSKCGFCTACFNGNYPLDISEVSKESDFKDVHFIKKLHIEK